MRYVLMVGGVVAAVLFLQAVLTDNDGGNISSTPPRQPSEQAPVSGFDKANYPSYDDPDLSGYATYLAKDDPNNCTASFASRVRRAAADTFTYQPFVPIEDTGEFLTLLRIACAAVGH